MTNNSYRERLRVLLILRHFSELYSEIENPHLVRVFKSEVKLQKIDFLIRYPSYLCYELLKMHYETGVPTASDVRKIVKSIFHSKEPQLRTDEMQRFFYGAYEELDNIISFLKSVNLVDFRSKKSIDMRDIRKQYFITQFGIDKIDRELIAVPSAHWYFQRCQLIFQYFGDLKGSALKDRQYEIQEYRDTPLGNYIEDIEAKVRENYKSTFQEEL